MTRKQVLTFFAMGLGILAVAIDITAINGNTYLVAFDKAKITGNVKYLHKFVCTITS